MKMGYEFRVLNLPLRLSFSISLSSSKVVMSPTHLKLYYYYCIMFSRVAYSMVGLWKHCLMIKFPSLSL